MYGGKALARHAYMGVGRNMAFRKQAYLTQDWNVQQRYLSGDDDIFISQFVEKDKIAVQMHPFSVSKSTVQPTISQYIQQRRRHLSTSAVYDWRNKAFLTIGPLSHVVFYIVGLWSMFSQPYVFPSLLIFALGYAILDTKRPN